MKKVCLVFIFCCFCLAIFAQNSNTATIYFASNSAELSETATNALKALLSNDAAIEKITVKAYTDDRGATSRNQILGQQRAQSVADFLQTQGVATELIELQAPEMLTLAANAGETERQKARRADVALFVKENPQEPSAALQNLLEQLTADARQTITFDANEGIEFTGKKGTIVQIPAQTFVDAQGNAYNGKVNFVLQEAHSYGDMVAQGMNTLSDGNLLETGGMVYIEATDVNGNPLQIADGKGITMSSPTPEANDPDMELYMGERDAQGNLNWKPTGQPVVSSAAQRYRRNLTFKPQFTDKDLHSAMNTLSVLPEFCAKMPRELYMPARLKRSPTMPFLRLNEKPEKADIQQRYIQKNSETNAEYTRRINQLFWDKMRRYNRIALSNRLNLNQYRRDSIAHERATTRYNQKMDLYRVYQTQMAQLNQSLQENMQLFDYEKYQRTTLNTDRMVWSASSLPTEMMGFADSLRRHLVGLNMPEAESLLSRLTSLQQRIDNKQQTNKLEKFSKLMGRQNSALYASFWKNDSERKSQKVLLGRWKSFRNQVLNFGKRTEGIAAQELRPYQLRKIRDFYQKLHYQFNTNAFNRCAARLQKGLTSHQQELTMVLQGAAELQNISTDFQTQIGMSDLVTAQDVIASSQMQLGRNQITVRRTGLVNWDKPFPIPTAPRDVEVLAQYDPNLIIYLVSEDSRVVVPMTATPNRQRYFASYLPEGMSVKIVGFRTTDQTAEAFVKAGKIGEIKDFKPAFEPKTVDELKTLLSQI